VLASRITITRMNSRYSRRDFLKVAAPAAVAVTESLAAPRSAQAAEPPPTYATVFFSEAEWKFINAAVDRLIPPDEHGPGDIEAGVPVFIDRQLEMPCGHGAYF
jgi:gluconate 2-dehydrogenase gamma chain